MKERIEEPDRNRFKMLNQHDIIRNNRQIEYIAIHCAATKPSMDVDRDRIRKWHLDRGFNDIGYHFVIKRDGTLETGRELWKTGAHVSGYNSNSIGICYVGGIDENGDPEDNRTIEQLSMMKRLLRELKEHYPNAKIRGHRDFPNVSKACPCFDVQDWCTKVGIDSN